MSLIHKYYCEICGAEKKDVNNWFMAEISVNGVLLSHWREEQAKSADSRHFCGEAHAQVFVSRYLSAPESFTRVRPHLDTQEKDLTAVQSHLVKKVMQQPSDMSAESEELFDLLAAAEAALKGRITVDSLSSDYFDA
jgi:spore coat polysaccharide biosynthesis protein SpsF (cytidylyltransferase family)